MQTVSPLCRFRRSDYLHLARWSCALLMVLVVYKHGQATENDTAQWKITTKEDRFSGKTSVKMTAEINFCSYYQVECIDGAPYAQFAMSCDKRPAMIYEGIIRIDDHAPTLSNFKGLEDSPSLYSPLTQETFSRLMDARRISVRVGLGNDTVQDMDFAVVPSAEGRAALLAACPIDRLEPTAPMSADLSKPLASPQTIDSFNATHRGQGDTKSAE